MPDLIAHTMEYRAGPVESPAVPEPYTDAYFDEYKRIYEDCFVDMRTALGLVPVNACDSREALLKKAGDIFVYREGGALIGSVAVYGNEIDDLFVAREHQRKGYGQMLLGFALARMQEKRISPIILHVADWNKAALGLYLKNGFEIVRTEIA